MIFLVGSKPFNDKSFLCRPKTDFSADIWNGVGKSVTGPNRFVAIRRSVEPLLFTFPRLVRLQLV